MAWESWKSSKTDQKLLWLACSAVWAALLVLAARFMDFNEPYLPFAMAGGLIFFLRNQPAILERTIWIIASVAFAPLVHFPHTQNWIFAGSAVLALFGFGAFLILGLQWVWSDGSDRRQTLAMMAPAAALVFFVFSAQRALSLANLLYPKTYDLYLFVADGSFGFQPSFVLGRAMAGSYAFRAAALMAYLSLPFVMALVYALRLPRKTETPSWDIISLLMLAGISGWALYNVGPATGPIYLFGANFPWQTLPYHALPKLFLEQIPISGDAPRNAIPSLHMAWVLLLFWNSKRLGPIVRIFLAVYVALTVASTLGTGEHYFVDLVAGVPLALFVQAAVSPGLRVPLSRRAIASGAGLALTMAWLLLVRFGVKTLLLTPILPWSLVLATAAGAWALLAWLNSSAEKSGNEPGSDLSAKNPEARPLAFAAHN
jgi:hypothetical protein